MKKLVLSLVLLITATSVGFGKPAYKQWKSYERLDEGGIESANNGLVRINYYLYGTEKKKDGNIMLMVYLNTNRIEKGKVDMYNLVSTTEAIDFTVGSNTVIFSTNVSRLESKGHTADGRYIYQVVFKDLDVGLLSDGWVTFITVFKIPTQISIPTGAFYKRFTKEVERRAEEEELKRFEEYRDNLDNRYNALVKNYELKYNGAMGGYSVWSKKPAPRTATRFDVALSIDEDHHMTFWRDSGHEGHRVVGYIQFQLIIPQVSSYFVDVGAIYTADGEYSLRYPFSFYNGEMLTENGMSKARYSFSVVMTPRVVKESGKLEYLNKMFNSGKPIYIEFRGQVIGSMKYQLTAQDIARVKDLLKFINELQGGF